VNRANDSLVSMRTQVIRHRDRARVLEVMTSAAAALRDAPDGSISEGRWLLITARLFGEAKSLGCAAEAQTIYDSVLAESS
jgi:hypothetical protein